MLQLDLESAYQRIERGKFYDFLDQVSAGGDEIKIIRLLIDGFAGDAEGLEAQVGGHREGWRGLVADGDGHLSA